MLNLKHLSVFRKVVSILPPQSDAGITLIGRPAGRAGWKVVFPNEKRELSAGWQAAQKIEGWAGGLQKRTEQAAQKGSPLARPFPLSSLMCNSPTRLNNVQPTGPSCGAVCRPALVCSSPTCGKFMFFILQHGPLISVIPMQAATDQLELLRRQSNIRSRGIMQCKE